jgi:phage-related protein
MHFNERLTYVSSAGRVEFSARRLLTPYWLDNADGIDGLENNVYTSKGSGQHGETFTSQNLNPRSITIEGKISSDQALNKRRLLAILNPTLPGRLIYETDGIVRYVACYIKKAPAFSNTRIERFQIELICPYPFWREGDGTAMAVVDIAEWVANWEFDLEFTDEGLEFEYRAPSLIVNINNAGDVPAGLRIEFRATGATSNPSLVNVGTQEALSLTIDLQAGDVLTVCTGYGEKRAELLRGGVTTNVFNCVDVTSTWLQLNVGDNMFRCFASEQANLDVSVYYDIAYLGV